MPDSVDRAAAAGLVSALAGAVLGVTGMTVGLVRKRHEVVTPIIGLVLSGWALLVSPAWVLLPALFRP